MAFTVFGKTPTSENRLVLELRSALAPFSETTVSGAQESSGLGSIVFVEEGVPNLDGLLAGLDRSGRAVYLVIEDSAEMPAAWMEGRVDDVLLRPIRPLDVLSKVRYHGQTAMWEEVNRLNTSFSELLGRLQEDLHFAERIQKSKLPDRFPEIKGLHVAHRYLAGMKSGGDYLDLAESKDKSLLSMVLSDSSSYGLSSNVLGVLMRVAMKLSSDEARSCRETVRRIFEELKLTLNDKDRLSLFYGVLSRKDYRLRYLNFGTSMAFYSAGETAAFQALPVQAPAITRASGMPELSAAEGSVRDAEVALAPGGRLVLLSDGFVDASGGVGGAQELLQRFRSSESKDLLNELVFAVKSKFSEPDDLPEQDCTCAVFDVDAKIIRKL